MIAGTRTRTILTLVAVTMAIICLTAAPTHAKLVVEEQFAYEILDPDGEDTQTPLNGLDGGIGFDGAWTATESHGRLLRVGLLIFAGGDPLTFDDDRGLHFSDTNGDEVPVAGSAVSRYGAAGRTQADRLLSAESQDALTQDNTTIWFSALVGGSSDYTNSFFLFGTDPLIHTNIGQIAAPGQGFGFNLSANINALAFNDAIDSTIVEGTYAQTLQQGSAHYDTSLIVGKINWKPNGTPDELFLFNVTDMSKQPDEADAIVSITHLDFDQSAFDTVTYADGAWGVIDEIRFATTFANVMGVLNSNIASSPAPANGMSDVLRDSELNWSQGQFAAAHNVYVGDSFEDVNSATVPTLSGLEVNSFDPGRLDFGQTVYWRVDEVNGTPDKTVFKGDVWRFEVEPVSIRVGLDAITVTASSTDKDTTDPQYTIDGSGLSTDPANGVETHSNEVANVMWMSASGDPSPWLMYEFNTVQKLDKLLIWNSNHSSEVVIGWGIKEADIQVSMDGLDWTSVSDVGPIARGSGFVPIEAQAIDLGLAVAKYVKIDILSNWGGLLPQYGVAEVQFYTLPTWARTPDPASGSADIHPTTVVSWRAGREASQHTVSVSTDTNAVADGTAGSVSTPENSLDLTSLDLQMGQTYYWRVDEVNEAEVPSVWAGSVWNLSTPAALIVDDFEGYNNVSPDRPFQTWLDGIGYSPDEFFPVEYGGNGTGAAVGHDIWSVASPYFNGNIMEKQRTIAGSNQSMPFYFNGASETERALAMDFTLGGAKTLSIPFRGQSGNTGTLYAKINGVKVTYPRDAANIAKAVWQVFNIDLTSVSTNIESVTKLAIGVEGNASGMLLIDDITLHAEAGELITPVDPGSDGLVAQYTFESNMNDSSGHGNHGTVVGTDGTQIVSDPARGQVLSLPGGNDQYVEIGAVGISGTMPRTIACWAKAADTAITDWTLIFGFTGKTVEDGTGGNGSHFNIGSIGGPGGIGAHSWGWEETMVSDEEGLNWHHYAMTYDGTTIAYFVDGMALDSDAGKSNVQDLSTSGDRVHIGSRVTQLSSFPGHVDDAVIYDRVLSPEEILWQAGVTTPIDKPF